MAKIVGRARKAGGGEEVRFHWQGGAGKLY